MSTSEDETTKWVRESAQYLLERKAWGERLHNSDASKMVRFRLKEVRVALKNAEAASRHLTLRRDLETRYELPGGAHFKELHSRIADAQAKCINATEGFDREFRELRKSYGRNDTEIGHEFHRGAIRLADAECGVSEPEKARRLAERILREAKIPVAQWGSDKSVTNWLKAIREK